MRGLAASRSRLGRLLVWFAGAAALAVPAFRPMFACDICAVYTATELQQSRTGLRLGLAQQVSYFSTLQESGDEIANPNDEHMLSSISQFLVGYQAHPRVGLQLSVPYIVRDFRRAVAGEPEPCWLEPLCGPPKATTAIDDGSVSGFGDVSFLVDWLAYRHVDEAGVLRLSLLAGAKLPSGSTDRLAEEVAPAASASTTAATTVEPNGYQSVRQGHRWAGPVSGIHGHDLALGTGSLDGVFGVSALWTRRRLFSSARVQYILRQQGDYGYEYADELTGGLSPGWFVALDHRYSLALLASITVENKAKDTLQGQRLADTAYTGLYAGPGLHFTWGSQLSVDLTGDIPAVRNNSDIQMVPDYRLRGGLMWRF